MTLVLAFSWTRCSRIRRRLETPAADMVMFNIGGKERNPDMFSDIVREAGTKVVKIRRLGTEIGF